jgi:hypothetical protein
VISVLVLYGDSVTRTFCIVTVLMGSCFVLCQWYAYMFCIVTVERVHVSYCDSDTRTCSVLWQWNVYMFCIVTVVRVRVLYCDSGTGGKKFEKQWF